jgi:late competence protein required for DNA uptake (superfamily II DNA/RNA helicase)
VEEYNLVKKIMAAGNIEEAGKIEASQKALSDNLLKKRDQYIAERINNTLGAGETGILFLGMLHSLENLLDNDILVTYPLFKPYKMMTKGKSRDLEK